MGVRKGWIRQLAVVCDFKVNFHLFVEGLIRFRGVYLTHVDFTVISV